MNSVQTAFSSARFNRLMLWVGGVVLVAGVLVILSTIIRGTDNTTFGPENGFHPTLPARSVPLKNAHGMTVRTFFQLDPAVRSTIRTFIATAVARKNLGAAWGVTAPTLKVGYTYTSWKNAKALPVIPFPVDNVDRVQYYLDYASTHEILIEAGLAATPKAKLHSTTFQIGLSLFGKGSHKQWLVDYWMPRWTPPLRMN